MATLPGLVDPDLAKELAEYIFKGCSIEGIEEAFSGIPFAELDDHGDAYLRIAVGVLGIVRNHQERLRQ